MDALNLLETQWQYLLSMLPAESELEASARASGALLRRRVVRSAETLLRLVLAYCCGLSLRQTGCWAGVQGLGGMSQVGVMKCLRRSASWLGLLVGEKLAQRAQCREVQGFRLRLVDATTVSAPGSQGTDWRVHLGFDLGSLSIDSVELTGAEGGESLSRFQVGPREVLIGDRGYAHVRGLWSVRQAGGDFLVRLNWQNLPLQTPQGEKFDLLQAARQLVDTEAAELAVQTVATRKVPAMAARVVMLRKSERASEEARRKILQEARKRGRQVDPRTLEAASYIFLLTSLPAGQLKTVQVLELYRFRWQVELAFKRLKSLWDFGSVPVKDPELARTYIYAKLLMALLVEDLTEALRTHSPWGFRLRAARA
ncbi:MAG TPA: IS4 family transposase [Thermoanaerobaculia bacterium]|nr:IS4 family transposase [Thermoanaerobaculia bacterium]